MLAVRALWLLGLLSLGLFAGLAAYLSPLKPSILELQFAFTPRAFGAVIHQWSAEDLQRYRAHLPVDFLLLLTYGAFGVVVVRTVGSFKLESTRLRHLSAAALPTAAACDAGENLLHYWLTEAPRFGVGYVYVVSASLSLVKWLLLIAFGLLVARTLLRTEA